MTILAPFLSIGVKKYSAGILIDYILFISLNLYFSLKKTTILLILWLSFHKQGISFFFLKFSSFVLSNSFSIEVCLSFLVTFILGYLFFNAIINGIIFIFQCLLLAYRKKIILCSDFRLNSDLFNSHMNFNVCRFFGIFKVYNHVMIVVLFLSF